MRISKIAVVDYGVGNLFNLQRALAYLDCKCEITQDSHKIRQADKIILPGVGAYKHGMNNLLKNGIIECIYELQKAGKLILGICLGMQLLMDSSEENGNTRGLSLIPGNVKRLQTSNDHKCIKIPHIGWNELQPGQNWESTILSGLKYNSDVYFVHSYYVDASDPSMVTAITTYGINQFCSVIQSENLIGCQFHPELSGETGLKILSNFLKMKV